MAIDYIKVANVKVMNLEGAIRGMRNPLESWMKSDSDWVKPEVSDVENPCYLKQYYNQGYIYQLGENDYDLAMRLVKAGSDHRKFLRQILVSMDINAPSLFWREFDTYKIGTVANSTSQMQTIGNRELTKYDFAYIDESTLNKINSIIKMYQHTGDKDYRDLIYHIMPASFLYTRTVTLNYEVLRNMYHARKNHKLSQWRTFCKYISHFPYSQLITTQTTK